MNVGVTNVEINTMPTKNVPHTRAAFKRINGAQEKLAR